MNTDENANLLQNESGTDKSYNGTQHKVAEESSDQTNSLVKKQKVSSFIFNFLNTTIGSGVLTVPFSMSRAGYAIGLIIIIGFAILSIFSYKLLIETANRSHKFQYDVLTDALFPGRKWIGYVTIAASMLFSVGCVLSYVIVIKDNFFFFTNDEVLYRSLLLAGIMFLIVLPLCYIPDMERFKFSSILALCIIIYVDVILVYTFGDKDSKGTAPAPGFQPVINSMTFMQAFSLTTQAYNAQYNFLNLYKELENRKQNAMKSVSAGIGIVLCIYLTFGMFGYASYGSSTQSDILKNLALEKVGAEAILAEIANIGVVIQMICCYPLPVYSLRKSIESLVFECTKKRAIVWVQRLLSTGIVVVATFTAMFIPSVDCVLDFTSSLAGGTIAFIMPGVYLWRMGYLNKEQNRVQQICWGVVMTVIGFLITIVGFGMAIFQWIVCSLPNHPGICSMFD